MKHLIPNLKMGQKVWATIEEILDANEMIVNFDGDLLRVGNQSQRNFRVGQRIQLNVESLNPLQFKLVETKRLNFQGLNIEV